MLTLRQYLDQFVRKEHTVELRRLMSEVGVTREFVYMLAQGKAASLNKALLIYKVTGGRVDPRTLACNVDWESLDAYYRNEKGEAAPTTPAKAVARSGRPGVAGKAGKRVQPAGRGTGPSSAGKAARKGSRKA